MAQAVDISGLQTAFSQLAQARSIQQQREDQRRREKEAKDQANAQAKANRVTSNLQAVGAITGAIAGSFAANPWAGAAAGAGLGSSIGSLLGSFSPQAKAAGVDQSQQVNAGVNVGVQGLQLGAQAQKESKITDNNIAVNTDTKKRVIDNVPAQTESVQAIPVELPPEDYNKRVLAITGSDTISDTTETGTPVLRNILTGETKLDQVGVYEANQERLKKADTEKETKKQSLENTKGFNQFLSKKNLTVDETKEAILQKYNSGLTLADIDSKFLDQRLRTTAEKKYLPQIKEANDMETLTKIQTEIDQLEVPSEKIEKRMLAKTKLIENKENDKVRQALGKAKDSDEIKEIMGNFVESGVDVQPGTQEFSEKRIASFEKVPTTSKGKGYNDLVAINAAKKAFKEEYPDNKHTNKSSFKGSPEEKEIFLEQEKIKHRKIVFENTSLSDEAKAKIVKLNKKSEEKIAELEKPVEKGETENKKESFQKTMIAKIKKEIIAGDSQAKAKAIKLITESNSPKNEKDEMINFLNVTFPDEQKKDTASQKVGQLGVGSLGVGSLGL